MRIKILAVGLVCFYLLTYPGLAQIGQEEKAKEPTTKLEAFLAKKGKLIVKEFYRLGEITGSYETKIEFTAIVMFEPGQERQRVRGLKIEITKGGKYEKKKASFLDLEEIESLSDAIVYMIDLAEKWKELKKEYTEAIFSTKGDFSIGFFQQGFNQGAFSSSGRIGKVNCFFRSIKDLNSVKDKADKGFNLLNEK